MDSDLKSLDNIHLAHLLISDPMASGDLSYAMLQAKFPHFIDPSSLTTFESTEREKYLEYQALYEL